MTQSGQSILQTVTVQMNTKYFQLAQLQATYSLDPNKKVGCVIEKEGKILGLGYNHFPKGVASTEERWKDRDYKNLIVIHAEVSALLDANNCNGATLYCTSFLCCTCAGLAIQRGINRVVAPQPEAWSSWYRNFTVARSILREAGVTIDYVR
jgi:dCMP deaminase